VKFSRYHSAGLFYSDVSQFRHTYHSSQISESLDA